MTKENYEEKQETNLDHYKDDIAKLFIDKLALVNGKPERCENVTQCDGFCDLYEKCTEHKVQEELKKWLKQPYKKPVYKLTQFEYDLLNAYKNAGMRKCITNYSTLLDLYEKGHIKDIDTSTPIYEILDNCEVIK